MNPEQLEAVAKVLFDAAYNAWSMSLELNLLNDTEHSRDLRNPQIGDYVIETTNPLVPRLWAVGKLVEMIDPGSGFKVYRIERIDGVIQNWENAQFVKVADEGTLSLKF